MLDSKALQRALAAKGLYAGNIDGDIGAGSLAALMCVAAGVKSASTLVTDLGIALAHVRAAYDITTALRLCHMLAQACKETDWFRTLEEYGSDAYLGRYNGRADLGNTQPGDGPRFKGRGFLMTTGRTNYKAAGLRTGVDLISHPEHLGEPDMAVLTAAVFWGDHHINRLADADDIEGVTKAVNGGLNGLADRKLALGRLKTVWGL